MNDIHIVQMKMPAQILLAVKRKNAGVNTNAVRVL